MLVTVAPVGDALLRACPPNALLVLGNRGAGRLQDPVPGSLTQKPMEAARCDVVLVPTPAGDESVVAGLAANATRLRRRSAPSAAHAIVVGAHFGTKDPVAVPLALSRSS